MLKKIRDKCQDEGEGLYSVATSAPSSYDDGFWIDADFGSIGIALLMVSIWSTMKEDPTLAFPG